MKKYEEGEINCIPTFFRKKKKIISPDDFIFLCCSPTQVILDEWQIEKKAMLNINSVAEKLVSCCLRSLPENETPNEAIKADSAAIGKTVETIQDR